EDGIRDRTVTGVQTCALPIYHPLGGLGYANFADEVAQQESELCVFFDTIITATCTGSTQAGMVVGFRAQERARRVIGIDTAANQIGRASCRERGEGTEVAGVV